MCACVRERSAWTGGVDERGGLAAEAEAVGCANLSSGAVCPGGAGTRHEEKAGLPGEEQGRWGVRGTVRI